MNKSDVIERVAGAAGVRRQEAESVIDAFFTTLKSAVREGDKVSWPSFGSFSASERKARTGRNPRTGAEVKIPATRVVKFSPGTALKDFMNTKSRSAAASSKRSGPGKSAGKAAGKAAPAKKTTKSKKR